MKEQLMRQIIAKQDELISRKCKHNPNCWVNQNWTEARMAMADTPSQYKDAGYFEALQEIERKSQTCSCGLDNLVNKLASLRQQLAASETHIIDEMDNTPYEIIFNGRTYTRK
jgi:hypothetical protein